jgi:light-harvesting complex 1 beta chain
MAQSDSDLVPSKWKLLFNNEEWLVHDIIVKSTFGFLAIAVVAHILVWAWTPWLR